MTADEKYNPAGQLSGTLVAGTVVTHYRVIRKIGSGGMSEVFLGEDTELSRKAALKFLLPHYVADERFKARFKREAQAVAALEHPNIVTIYEVGEFQGWPFYAMQYVDGQSLADLIKGDRLPVYDIIDLVIQIGEGLSKAHEERITHRDIKPSNILIDPDGRAKLVDFGLATIHGSDHLTKTGSLIGTVSYMSPEQAQGKEIDCRSDLFSLGIVFYEMVTGRTPFDRDNIVATAQAIAHDTPERLTSYRENVPADLQRIISRLLQKDREARYQHVGDLLADLRSLRRALEAGNVVLAKRIRSHQPSIAVLPFANLTAEEGQDYFCEGIAEEIINSLAKVRDLQVAARTSAFVYKKRQEDIRSIGQKLNVEAVLEGSVRQAGNQLRITVQLIDTANGYHLWSERFDREFADIFAIQDEIAENVMQALKIILSEEEKRAITRTPTRDIKAYDYYLRGRQFFHQGRRRSLLYARDMFARAIEIDPNYALAYAGMADCCSFLIHYYPHTGETSVEEAAAASRKAIELDPRLAEAHAAHGFALWLMKRHDEAHAEFETAILLDPKQFEARYLYGRASFQRGNLVEALHLFEEACLVREDHEARFFAAQTYAALGRTERAKSAYRRALQVIEKHLGLNPDDARALTMGAVSLCRVGRREEGLAWAERASAIDPEDPGVRYNVACLFALEGQKERAIDSLEKAFQAGFANMEWVEKDPDLASLRDDPRLQALLTQ
ncbi:protein kinase [Candidatus Zixiibacteriota bacterium]